MSVLKYVIAHQMVWIDMYVNNSKKVFMYWFLDVEEG